MQDDPLPHMFLLDHISPPPPGSPESFAVRFKLPLPPCYERLYRYAAQFQNSIASGSSSTSPDNSSPIYLHVTAHLPPAYPFKPPRLVVDGPHPFLHPSVVVVTESPSAAERRTALGWRDDSSEKEKEFQVKHLVCLQVIDKWYSIFACDEMRGEVEERSLSSPVCAVG